MTAKKRTIFAIPLRISYLISVYDSSQGWGDGGGGEGGGGTLLTVWYGILVLPYEAIKLASNTQ